VIFHGSALLTTVLQSVCQKDGRGRNSGYASSLLSVDTTCLTVPLVHCFHSLSRAQQKPPTMT
jgi:hypothetical protein